MKKNRDLELKADLTPFDPPWPAIRSWSGSIPATVTASVQALRATGHEVTAVELPGLWSVDGRELTDGQVIDLATRIQP